MADSVAFLVGLLDEADPVALAAEDFAGPHGPAAAHWREHDFVGTEATLNPCPCCPHCGDGTPAPVCDRFVCDRCRSDVAEADLRLWPFRPVAVLRWLAHRWGLAGGVRRVEECLYSLGRRVTEAGVVECFFRRAGRLTEFGRRVIAHRPGAVVLFGRAAPPEADDSAGRWVSLFDVLHGEDGLGTVDFDVMLGGPAGVRFDAETGELLVGGRVVGEVPPDSREFHFLDRLSRGLGRLVPYADLKRHVLSRTGTRAETDDATFCHKLKHRLKRRIPGIDRFLVTTNRADGYRLRGREESGGWGSQSVRGERHMTRPPS